MIFTQHAYGPSVAQSYTATDGPTGDNHIYISGFDPVTDDMIILKIDYSGAVVATFTIPPSGGWAGQVVVGSDGNLWMNNPRSGFSPATMQIDISTGAVVASIPPISPDFEANTGGNALTVGPDGAFWSFVRASTTTGTITQTTLAGAQSTWTVDGLGGTGYEVFPMSMCVGSDGNMWATCNEPSGPNYPLYRITTAGVVTGFFPGPTQMYAIIGASDGYLWATNNGLLSKMDTTGTLVATYTVNSADWFTCMAEHPTTHHLWMADDNSGDIYEVDLTGTIVSFYPAVIDLTTVGPYSIIIDKSGGVWVYASNGAYNSPSYVDLYKLGPGGAQLVMLL